ncbi:MAG: fumarylacetoacetate hydrolase family protein [Alphaproteobacteria bacterium]|nr:fumarylacetoacetate hydrolase family protein [Alphaproteobacteria bacterium]
MSFVISPQPQASVAIAGSDERFPVRRIFCVGRNYADHVREMGNDPKSEPPLFFSKPADAVVESGAVIPYPSNTSNFHHEVELVVAVGTGGSNIDEASALSHVWGYGVGVDLTRRDRQAEAKKAGTPWDTAKGFDRSAPISTLTPMSASGDAANARIWIKINGETRQDANTHDMIWSIPEIIAALSHWWELKPGDLIFTGSPSGVSALNPGDTIECGIDRLAPLKFSIAR